jgi:DNA repair photolyase
VRDIDVLRRFALLRVNMTIPTDDEEVKAAFEPKAPPLERRWRALADLSAEGIPVGVCVTPMLPLRDPAAFVARIAALGPAVVVTQHFHDSGNGFGADTGGKARELLRDRGWTEDDYRACVARMRESMPVHEGEAGFFPPGGSGTRD